MDLANGIITSNAIFVLSHSTLVDVLFPLLSVRDILSIELVCHSTRSAVKAWLPIAYRIDQHLRQYFDDPVSFRRLQARTGTLISGSNALQFFERTYYAGSDVDLYTPRKHALEVALWLETHNYVFRPAAFHRTRIERLDPDARYPPILHGVEGGLRISGQPAERFLQAVSTTGIDLTWIEPIREVQPEEEYEFRGMSTVLTFLSATPALDDTDRQKVDVIVATGQSTPFACILNFHSTLVMNFLAHDMAYSLFPNATFLRRTTLTLRDNMKTVAARDRIYSKYRQRGFNISEFAMPLEREPGSNTCHFLDKHTGIWLKPRFVGDRNGWRIPFDTSDLLDQDQAEKATFSSECLRHCGFSLLPRRNDPDWNIPDSSLFVAGDYPFLRYRVIFSPSLENVFILPHEQFKGALSLMSSKEALIWHFLKMMTNEINSGLHEMREAEERFWDKDLVQLLQKIMTYIDTVQPT